MPRTVDFRTAAFDAGRVDGSGKDIGRNVYWKLYAVENIVRVLVHSVLTAEIGPGWWAFGVASDLQKRVAKVISGYAASPWHTYPGRHELYFTFLSDLNEIIRANRNLFLPTIPDIDQWIARLEQVRLPRNVVGHMNWPSKTDRQRIDVVYADLQALLRQIRQTGSVPSLIP
jgi:hypothetical protein